MGQIIELKTTKLNKSIILDLNNLSGQEGMSFRNISEAFQQMMYGKLAFDLFKKINDIETIFIQSNVITINFSRNIGTETELIEELVKIFIFYKEEEE